MTELYKGAGPNATHPPLIPKGHYRNENLEIKRLGDKEINKCPNLLISSLLISILEGMRQFLLRQQRRMTRGRPLCKVSPACGVMFSVVIPALLLFLTACATTQAQSAATPTPLPTPSPTATAVPTATPTLTPTPVPESACPLPNLYAGQHISAGGSYTQTQTAAAGPMHCRIEPGSCGYHRLVGNVDPSIVFKQEEEPPFDEEDILMHPAVILPLYRLNELVQAEWGGSYRLRVTDAYDSLLEHDLGQPDENRKISLHFEGRAIDITTWPIDTSRYARLCALAHCAGFDWVHNEGDHCHAAIKAESLCVGCGN